MHIHKRETPDIALHTNPLFSFLFTNYTFKYNKLNFETKEGVEDLQQSLATKCGCQLINYNYSYL